eukprot:m.568267 g.568267  ORF g.568267 m.568267 type:complete len:153 (-) comp22257_c0_seq48:247-705(-)
MFDEAVMGRSGVHSFARSAASNDSHSVTVPWQTVCSTVRRDNCVDRPLLPPLTPRRGLFAHLMNAAMPTTTKLTTAVDGCITYFSFWPSLGDCTTLIEALADLARQEVQCSCCMTRLDCPYVDTLVRERARHRMRHMLVGRWKRNHDNGQRL